MRCFSLQPLRQRVSLLAGICALLLWSANGAAQQYWQQGWDEPVPPEAPQRYNPWSAETPGAAAPTRRNGPSDGYRGNYGQRTWSNLGRAQPEWDGYGRPEGESPTVNRSFPQPPQSVAPVYGGGWMNNSAGMLNPPVWGTYPYPGSLLGPGYGWGLGGLSPWSTWGW